MAALSFAAQALLSQEDMSPWQWSLRSDPALDFAVQILVADGLLVPPFAGHPAGKGDLQMAGMRPEDWVEWIDRLVGAIQSRQGDRPIHPVLFWPGRRKLRPIVAARWEIYCLRPNPLPLPKVDISEVSRLIAGESSSIGVNSRMHRLTFYVVGYEWPSLYMAKPDTAMIGDKSGELTSSDVADSIRKAIGWHQSGSSGA